MRTCEAAVNWAKTDRRLCLAKICAFFVEFKTDGEMTLVRGRMRQAQDCRKGADAATHLLAQRALLTL
eukprot:2559585-Pleurochrysis_carterae.AAC.1